MNENLIDVLIFIYENYMDDENKVPQDQIMLEEELSRAGFEKEDLPCLFDRFYRGKNQNATGYGIGLALCKMIITRQGGTITAKNQSQGGALFSIRFPK